MKLNIVSFGFRHGAFKADEIFDCRALANPHRDRNLKDMTGMDREVATFVFNDPAAYKLMNRAINAIQIRVEDFQPQIYVGFGCVGGKHRSVALAEAVGGYMREKGVDTTVFHRELRKFR